MRVTFAHATRTPLLYQGALACLPMAVDFFTKRLLSEIALTQHQASRLSLLLSTVSLFTLKENKWALGGGALLLVIYQLYKAYVPISSQRPQYFPPPPSTSSPRLPHSSSQLSTSSSRSILDKLLDVRTKIGDILFTSKNEQVYWEPKYITQIIQPLMELIQKNGIHEEGLYRVSGADALIKKNLQYLDAFYKENRTFMIDTALAGLSLEKDIPRATSICKGLFKRLKVPLLQPIVKKLLKASSKKEQKKFIAAIKKLDPDRQELLHTTLKHLKAVTQNSVHKMNSANLARIFALCFFEASDLAQLSPQMAVVDYLIKNVDQLFT